MEEQKKKKVELQAIEAAHKVIREWKKIKEKDTW